LQKGNLYLIPVSLGNYDLTRTIPPYVHQVIQLIDYYIVENIKSALAFLKSTGINKNPAELRFNLISSETSPARISEYIKPALSGHHIGLLSEAGVPCVADPGSEVVSIAHENNIRVIPLTGPSSIILALMASGLNGQNFLFAGYLPADKNRRNRSLAEISSDVLRTGKTVIFIEAPHRNDKLFESILESVNRNLKLCIAKNITFDDEFIKTKYIHQWKKEKIILGKTPVIYLIGR
jgi:16S rRNA (cytidine1402-2'-O)-methyltransferase